jgi:hypothetical protein
VPRLLTLVGARTVALRWSVRTHKLVGAPREINTKAEISLLDRGGILHYQIEPPYGLVGRGETDEAYPVLGTDERHLLRVDPVSFGCGLWRFWRDAPRFRPRFEGKLRDGRGRIEDFWDTAEVGGS